MRVTRWMWLGPVAFLVHDAEEVATIVPWVGAHRGALPALAQPSADITTRGFAVSVLVLLAGFVVVTSWGVHQAARERRSWLWLAVAGAFVANGVTHVAQGIWFGDYVPGLVTALIVSIPYGLGAARAYRGAGLATTRELAAAGGIGLLLQVPMVLAALAAGRIWR